MQLKKYVSDFLGEERIVKFQRGHPICITTPPDSGKTTFILNKICREARGKKQRVVLFVNRKALFMETKYKMLCSELQQYITDGHLLIVEIQNLETNDARSERLKQKIESCDIICVDETHYFISDALFNPRTEISFDFLTGLIKSHILIFMSATSENFIRIINDQLRKIFEDDLKQYEKECRIYQNNVEEVREKLYFEKTGCTPDGSLSMYYETEEELEWEVTLSGYAPPELPRKMELEIIDCIEPDYSYCDILHFSKLQDLIPIVEKSSGKWLLFVSSKEEGKELKKELEVLFRQKQKKISVGFVDTDYKQDSGAYEIVDLITREGKLKVDILISTSTLDNGVNILDSKLQHVVLMTFDRTQFIQMVNRKRVRNGERVNLYICDGSEGLFSRKIHRLVSDYEAVRVIAQKGYITSADKIVKDEKLLRLKDALFYRLDSGRWKLSRLSLLALQIQYNFVSEVVENLKTNPHAFLQLQYQWLGLEFKDGDVCKDVRVGQKNVEKVRLMLEEFDNMECPVWTQDEFKKIADKILTLLGEKMNQKPISLLNATLKKYAPLQNYVFNSQHNHRLGTYYILGELHYPKMKPEYQDLEKVRMIVHRLQDYQEAFDLLFGAVVPEFFQHNQEYTKEYMRKAVENSGVNWYLKSKSNGYLEVISRC